MPSNLALASTWDRSAWRACRARRSAPRRARRASIVLLGGTANLIRDPRGGRNFEYFSEDPLLTGVMAGAHDRGRAEPPHHLDDQAFRAQCAGNRPGRARRANRPAAARESDLLAFEIAIERGRPGSVMCAYNQVNGALFLRERLAPQRGAEARLALSRLRDVRLGRGPFDRRVGAGGARSGIGRATRHRNFFGAALAHAVADGEVPPAQARRHGAANLDVDLRARPRR